MISGVIPCYRGGHHCSWPACPQDCDGRPGRQAKEIITMIRTRVITFRGEDHTVVIHDSDGNWSVYRGGDSDEISFDSLTEKEQQELNDYVYDWRTDS